MQQRLRRMSFRTLGRSSALSCDPLRSATATATATATQRRQRQRFSGHGICLGVRNDQGNRFQQPAEAPQGNNLQHSSSANSRSRHSLTSPKYTSVEVRDHAETTEDAERRHRGHREVLIPSSVCSVGLGSVLSVVSPAVTNLRGPELSAVPQARDQRSGLRGACLDDLLLV